MNNCSTIRYHNPAKKYMQQYIAAKAQYASLYREIERWRESLTGTTIQLKADVVSGGGVSDKMSATIAKIVDAESKLANEAAEISTALSAVLTAIRSVPDAMQRTVLTLRYIEGLDWIRISENIHYGERQTFVVHGRALVEVNRWLEGKKEGEAK